MNTTQLECFLAVAEFLNFSRAAEHLRLTQPAVSHQIKTLEDELGVRLFSRTIKNVRLTQEGQLFVQYAGEILKLTGASKAQVRQCRAERPLWLGIGCRSTADLQLIRPALERLRQEEKRVLPQLRLVPSSALDNLLAEGDIQVLFAFQENAPRGSVYRELIRCPVVCVCRPDHPLAAGDTLTIEQAKGAGRLAACRPNICPPLIANIQGQLTAGSGLGQMLFCENQEVALTLVEAGYAFAVMADFPGLRRPGLRYIPLADQQPLSFGAAWLGGGQSQVLRRFLALLEETIRLPQEAPAAVP